MRSPARKAIRDFWQERPRTALVVIAIALGISAFMGVLSAYAILTRELNKGYLATNPASATLWTDTVDEDLLRETVTGHGVSDAEARRVISGRIKAGPGEWRNLQLFAVKDYGNIRVSKISQEKGAWPPKVGEILIERDAFQVARTRIGETVTVRTISGPERTLQVTGGVHDVGQAQARMENVVYGYVTLDTLALLGETPKLDQLKILVAQNRFDEQHIRTVADEVKTFLESRGHTVRKMEVPQPGKHPHADINGLLLLAMSSFGIFVLLLSGILVFNLLMALMASQVRQIGMMKAVGGTRKQIAGIYFGQAAMLGITAILVALPIGLWGGRMLCSYLAKFLNFDITSFATPPWVFLLVAITGLVVPLIAAAYPVWKGSGVPVREALASFGVAGSRFGSAALERGLGRVSGLTRPVVLAMRNSFRRRTRLVLTVVTLAVGGIFFMSALNIRGSLIHTLDRLFAQKKYDLAVSFSGMYPWEKIERAVRKTPGVLDAEGWITTEGALAESASVAAPATKSASSGGAHAGEESGGGRHGGGSMGANRFVMAAVPTNTKMLQLEIAQGRNFQAGDIDAMLVNSALAAKYSQLKLGNTVRVRMGPGEAAWRVVGIVREPFSPPVAYIPREFFESHGHTGVVSTVRITLQKKDAASVNAVKASLDRNLEEEGLRAVVMQSQADSRYGFDQHMLMIYVFLMVMSCVIGAVGGLSLMTTLSLNVLERRREMGVLRAIGATPRVVWLIIVVEGTAVGLLSWVIAAFAAWPVSHAVGNFMALRLFKSGLDSFIQLRGVLIWLAVSLLLSTAASFLPALHASRRPIRDALGYE